MTFYVGNLSPDTTRDELLEAFRPHGRVVSVSVPGDRMKGDPASKAERGYAFVVMRDRSEGRAAASALDGRVLHGMPISVRVARPKRTPHYVS